MNGPPRHALQRARGVAPARRSSLERIQCPRCPQLQCVSNALRVAGDEFIHRPSARRLWQHRHVLVALICLLTGLALAPSIHSQEPPNHAGLVIQPGDGTTFTACVAFDEPSITGLELLRRAGVTVSADSSGGLGVTVCGLDGEGCNYPQDNCFCQCQGASCTYWQYWRLAEGEWQYAQIGASGQKVTDGSVNGWVWAEGDPGSGKKPPATTFDAICPAETLVTASSAAATPSHTPPARPTPIAEQPSTSALTPVPVQSTQTPAPPAASSAGASSTAYVAFVAIVLALVGLMVWQSRRT